MTFREAAERLRRNGIENAEWEASLLLEHFCSIPTAELYANAERDYSDPAFLSALERRASHEPLQYLLGEWSFYRQTYEVSPACLIPRPDTEILVEEAIRMLPRGAFFADLCTGSGCIAISVLAERPDLAAVAVDLSSDALEIARRNAVRNGVSERITFQRADVLNERFFPAIDRRLDAILSNPPYIPSGDLPSLSAEVHAEPQMALDGGRDGLDFYRALFPLSAKLLTEDGFCLFEIGYDQADAIGALAAASGFSCRIRKDFGANDRVAVLQRNKPEKPA